MDTYTPNTVVSLSDHTMDIHNPNTTVSSSPMRNITNDEVCQQQKPFLEWGEPRRNMVDTEILRIASLNVKTLKATQHMSVSY